MCSKGRAWKSAKFSMLFTVHCTIVQLLVDDFLFSIFNWRYKRFVLRKVMQAIYSTPDRQAKHEETWKVNDSSNQQSEKNRLMWGGLYWFSFADLLYEGLFHCYVNKRFSRVSSFESFQSPGDHNIRPLQWHYHRNGGPEKDAHCTVQEIPKRKAGYMTTLT